MKTDTALYEKLRREAEEACLALAACEYMAEEGEELLGEVDPSVEPPEEAKAALLKAVKRREVQNRLRAIGSGLLRAAKYAAMFVGVAAIGFAALYALSGDVRENVQGLFRVEAPMETADPLTLDASGIKATPTWVPEGYRLVSASSDGSKKFENAEGDYISFSYTAADETADPRQDANLSPPDKLDYGSRNSVPNGRGYYLAEYGGEQFAIWAEETANLNCAINSNTRLGDADITRFIMGLSLDP